MPFNRSAVAVQAPSISPLRTIAQSDGPLWLPPHGPDSPDKSGFLNSEAADVIVCVVLILTGAGFVAWASIATWVLGS